MKKQLFLILVTALLAVTSAFAQTRELQIFKGGSLIQSFPVTNIDSVKVGYAFNAPGSVTAQLSNKSILVSWSAVTGAKSYQLYRSGDNQNYTQLATNLTTTSYTDNAPIKGTNYYKVRAVGEGQKSVLSMASAPVLCDDDDPIQKEDPLSEEQKKFLGYWHCNNGTTDFMFLADGTCKSYSTSEENIKYGVVTEMLKVKSGNWNYNETAKILSTTIGGWQWTITQSPNLSWAGTSLNPDNPGAQSFSRSDMYHCCSYLRGYKWGPFSFEAFEEVANGYDSQKYFEDYLEYNRKISYPAYFGNEIELTDEIDKDLANYVQINQKDSYADYYRVNLMRGKIKWSNFKYENSVFTAKMKQDAEYSNYFGHGPFNITFDGTMKLTNAGSNNAKLTIEGNLRVAELNKTYNYRKEYSPQPISQ